MDIGVFLAEDTKYFKKEQTRFYGIESISS